MNCAEVNSVSSLYLSGKIEASRAAEVARHIATCPSCALQVQMHADLDNLLRQAILSEHVSTAALDRRVREHISAEARPREVSVVQRVAFIAVAAAVILILIVGLGYTLFLGHPAPVYADAAADHHDEIMDQQPRHWLTDPAAIAALAHEHGVSPAAIAAIRPAGYQLGCAKICTLNGHPFLHIVFVPDSTSKGPTREREVSLFLCPRTAMLPQSESASENGRTFHTPVVGAEHLACFETNKVTALVVTDQTGDAALRFASSAAQVF